MTFALGGRNKYGIETTNERPSDVWLWQEENLFYTTMEKRKML